MCWVSFGTASLIFSTTGHNVNEKEADTGDFLVEHPIHLEDWRYYTVVEHDESSKNCEGCNTWYEIACCSKCERLTELKAFRKLMWSSPSLVSALRIFLLAIFVEWMIASTPPLTPTPSWMESNHLIASDFASFTKHLTMRRLRILFTAIGRTPPFFLDRTVSDALQKAFEINEGHLPLLPVFTNLVIALKAD